MNTFINLLLAMLMLTPGLAFRSEADNNLWNNSPLNYANSPINYENSSINYNNNPINWENNPANLNSDRIVRDPDGDPMGYAVPKPDGGVNYFSLDGKREGYSPPQD